MSNDLKRPIDSSESLPNAKRSPNLYVELDNMLTHLRSEFVANGGTFLFSMNSPDLDIIRCIEQTGIAGIKEVSDEDGFREIELACGAAGADLHRNRLPDETIALWRLQPRAMDTNEHRRGAGQVWGNCGFAFIYGQMTTKEDLMWSSVGTEHIPFEYQPMHAYNIEWLSKRPALAEKIIALGRFSDPVKDAELPNPMVSWDSSKYIANPHVGTKKVLTEPHADIYSRQSKTHRRQMCIEFSERSALSNWARRLVYVPFTHVPEVQKIIGTILGNPLVFERAGFVGLDKDPKLCSVFEKHAIAYSGYHLAIWGDRVVHFEAFTKPLDEHSGLEIVCSRKLAKNEATKTGVLVRMVIGTHRPTLNRAELARLAVYAQDGFLPALYHRSLFKNTKVANNLMCSKTSRFKKPRSRTEQELQEFQNSTNKQVDTVVSSWTDAKRLLHGL